MQNFFLMWIRSEKINIRSPLAFGPLASKVCNMMFCNTCFFQTCKKVLPWLSEHHDVSKKQKQQFNFNLIYLFMSRQEVRSMNTHTLQNAG